MIVYKPKDEQYPVIMLYGQMDNNLFTIAQIFLDILNKL